MFIRLALCHIVKCQRSPFLDDLTAVVTPHLPTNILMSRRVPRLVEKYAKLSMEDRDKLEQIVDGMLGINEEQQI
jgi:hypothetical protein